ncbi:DNA repair protein RecN [Geminocystis sp. NIES-3709]|uniref:DNA repair protein RecN n=1 Tax=Geminocystis sp. NIES-3709 TaxID=1617448 RepID=UPI0005FC844E|nr:DNA repair protein RecN [Geminocystis sp. NIES-3709]BAQ65170.1 DNA repair protein RecN [Geminocystis sp. NIES-3709]
MLIAIRINNFALVDHIELEFGSGLNVLTGETGAGKSIILDAIDVVLGGKANQRMIRTGAKKAIVEASFQTYPDLETWLESQEVEPFHDDTVVCSRELTFSKDNFRSRCRVNGVVVNKQIITQLRDRLLEVTAQGETGQLLSASSQRDLLDDYGGKELITQRQLVNRSFIETQQAQEALEHCRESEQQRLQRLDLIQHQIRELGTIHLQSADELEHLEIESDRLTHVVELQQLSYQAYQLLYQSDSEENPAVTDILAKAEPIIRDMANYDKELNPILEIIQEALNQVVEAGQQIYSYGASLEADPERLEEVEERIRLLKRICRKYGPKLGDVIEYYDSLKKELTELTDNSKSIDELEREFQAHHDKLLKLCTKLSQLRQASAKKLETQLTQELKPLGMAKVQFQCRVTAVNPHSMGADHVEYYFSPNPGEDLQPLAITASGGEMSRFLLALKSCFTQTQINPKTLVFDEIDAGVSGKVAQAIAEKLHKLSSQHQVLCVTHQPLIAAMADDHFRVEKHLIQTEENQEVRTIVKVTHLEHQTHRRDELAELTGGNSAEEAIAFADSLLETAIQLKKQSIEVAH